MSDENKPTTPPELEFQIEAEDLIDDQDEKAMDIPEVVLGVACTRHCRFQLHDPAPVRGPGKIRGSRQRPRSIPTGSSWSSPKRTSRSMTRNMRTCTPRVRSA